MPTDEKLVLNYSRPRPRRYGRWILLVVLGAGIVAGTLWHRSIADFARERLRIFALYRAEQRVQTLQLPIGQLAFSDDPSDASTFQAGSPEICSAVLVDPTKLMLPARQGYGRTPKALDDFLGADSPIQRARGRQLWGGPPWNSPAIPFCPFVHIMASPAGHRRLVWVDGQTTPQSALPLLTPGVWIPGTPWTAGHAVQYSARANFFALIRGQPSDCIRLFVGQMDPADPSRFTIAGQCNGYPFTIAGRLGDDDKVVLSCDRGWELGDPPTIGRSDTMIACGPAELFNSPVMPRHIVIRDAGDWERPKKLMVSSDGSSILAVSDRRAVRVDLNTGQILRNIAMPSGLSAYFVEDLSPDGRYAVVGTEDGMLVLDCQTDRTLLSQDGEWEAAFCSDGDVLTADTAVTGSNPARFEIHRWEVPSFTPWPVVQLRETFAAYSASADGDVWVAVVTAHDRSSFEIRRFDRSGQRLNGVMQPGVLRHPPSLILEKSRKWLLALGGKQMLLYDAKTSQLVANQTIPTEDEDFYQEPLLAIARHVAALWQVPSGSLALVDIPSFSHFDRIAIGVPEVTAMTFSADGHWLMTAGISAGIDVWPVPADMQK